MASSAWQTGAVATADAALQRLGQQEDVQVRPYAANSGGFGQVLAGAPVSHPAMVVREQGRRKTAGGQEIPYRVTVAFTRPIVIDLRDLMTLQDGITGPVVDIDRGTIDPATGVACATTVFLGFGG